MPPPIFAPRKELPTTIALMSNVMSIAAIGLQTSAANFNIAAIKAVKAATPGSPSADELPSAIVDETTASIAFKTNLDVLKTADSMTKRLLDVTV